MVCDCIKNIFKGRRNTSSILNLVNEAKIDLKEQLIEIREDPLEANFKRSSFFCSSMVSPYSGPQERRSDVSQFWRCSMGNLHLNSQEYCRCLHISALNKLDKIEEKI